MTKRVNLVLLTFLIIVFSPLNFSKAGNLGQSLKGRILLQVESKGEAWYVNPDNQKRYYLGRPEDAFNVMRELGLGISSRDFNSFGDKAPGRLSGKILLKVEDSGKAYYVNPVDLKIHYLGRPTDAFNIMRELGLGIKNVDLDRILEGGQASTSNLKKLSNSEIVNKMKDSVVYIETKDGSGSGFITESTGFVLTNAHVVQGVSTADVIFSDNTTLSASVVGRDENVDLALLKVSKNGLKNSLLGDSNAVKQGDEIFTFGYPFGIKGEVSLKDGIIARKLTNSGHEYFEISAEIHPGNSGGPLVNRYGEVIGINTFSIGQSIQGISVGETIKFAIPINVAKNILNDLKNGRNIVDSTAKQQTPESPQIKSVCSNNISKLVITENKYLLWSMDYSLQNGDTDILLNSNEMKITGMIKNTDPACSAYNIKLRINIFDEKTSVVKQTEDVLLMKDLSPARGLYLNSQASSVFKAKITVFDSYIYCTNFALYCESKALEDGLKVQTNIISAEWSQD